MNKEKLQTLRGTEQWRTLKEEYLLEKIAELKDVTAPLIIGEDEITGIDAYNAKRISTKILERLISIIDTVKTEKKNTELYN